MYTRKRALLSTFRAIFEKIEMRSEKQLDT